MTNSPGRIPIAIVGLSFGRHMLDLLKTEPACDLFHLRAVCDLRPDLADSLSEEHGVKAYYSLDDLLKDPSVAAIGLFTTPDRRAELIRKILRAGKDVLTTKPFELNAQEALSVLREAQSLGRTIHLNSPSPTPTADVRQIERWCTEFDLGALVSARGEVWASYFEQRDGSWMDDPFLCPGGAMMRLGIYLINDILHLAGIPDSVQLLTSRVRTGRPTPDNALLALTFPNGCLGSIYTSFCVQDGDQYANGLSLHFERGSIYRNIGATRLTSGPERSHLSLVRLGDEGRQVENRTFTECSGEYQWQSFYEAISERQSISEEYIQLIVEGVRIMETLRQGPAELSPAVNDRPAGIYAIA